MAAGKTSVGKKLSSILKWNFIDTDKEIENKYKKSIKTIFDTKGEKFFRFIEQEIIQELKNLSYSIISTGGGVVLSKKNWETLTKIGKIIYLKTSIPEIIKRINKQPKQRPLINISEESKIKNLLEIREPLYNKADIIIDTTDKNIEEIALEIKQYIVKVIPVNLKTQSYKIYIGCFNNSELLEKLKQLNIGKKILLISNPNIYNLYGEGLFKTLQNEFDINKVIIPCGERYKTLNSVQKLYKIAANIKLNRDSSIISFGGGVIGDLAGFVASTYLRGINFIQIPTTLLSMVDSSIGGKTGVNLVYGKNLVGSFYQPRLVWINIKYLDKLPKKQIRDGLAEVVKIATISDKLFFYYLKNNIKEILNKNLFELIKVINQSCQLKVNIITKDEKEKDLRRILNFGHTFGHTLETIMFYRNLTHGEAISIGMVMATSIGVKEGITSRKTLEELKQLLVQIGLPVDIPCNINIKDIIKVMEFDKKILNNRINFIIPDDIGSCKIYDKIFFY